MKTRKKLECRACRNKRLGIKTRLKVLHTCGKDSKAFKEEKTLIDLDLREMVEVSKILNPLAFSPSNKGKWDVYLAHRLLIAKVFNERNDFQFIFDLKAETIRVEQWKVSEGDHEEIAVGWEYISQAVDYINSKGILFSWQK